MNRNRNQNNVLKRVRINFMQQKLDRINISGLFVFKVLMIASTIRDSVKMPTCLWNLALKKINYKDVVLQ